MTDPNPEPHPEADAQLRRRLAADANNAAWNLIERPSRTAAERDAMLDAAHASLFLWQPIGTELHAMRGRMTLAYAQALAGQGGDALRHARAVLQFFEANGCPDWEIAFVHGAMAVAAHAAGEPALHAGHHAEALRLRDAIADPEDRAIVDATLAHLPAPA